MTHNNLLFWLASIAGAGKTALASHVTQQLCMLRQEMSDLDRDLRRTGEVVKPTRNQVTTGLAALKSPTPMGCATFKAGIGATSLNPATCIRRH